MDDKNRLKFIEDLEIPDPPSSGPSLLSRSAAGTANAPSASVCGGAILSFTAGVSPPSRSDVLNSTLLAQLAANKKFDRENDTVQWYAFYREILENIGWVIQDFNFGKVNAGSSTFTMSKVVIDLVAAIASKEEAEIFTAAIDALKALPERDGRLVLFEKHSHSASKGNFQVGVANEIGGVLSMRLSAAYFNTTQNVTNVLWFGFGSAGTSVYGGAQAVSLNAQIYQRVRDDIVAKLGDRSHRYVQDIEI